MISFEYFEAVDGMPIYLQIIRHFKRGVASGTIKDGDEVPSRRYLSSLLGVNPNTIQKAYKALEEEGLMESRSGAKSYMVLTEQAISDVRKQLLEHEVQAVISSLKQMGLSKTEALSWIENYWE